MILWMQQRCKQINMRTGKLDTKNDKMCRDASDAINAGKVKTKILGDAIWFEIERDENLKNCN